MTTALFVALLTANPAAVSVAPAPLPVTLQLEPQAGAPHEVVYRLTNRGAEPLDILTHRGLLSLELVAPGRRRPVRCATPGGARPGAVDPSLIAVLAPGATYAERVDLRYYCWGKRLDELRRAGVQVRARYGFRRASPRTWAVQSPDGARRLAALEAPEVTLPALPAPAPEADEPMGLTLRPSHQESTQGQVVSVTARLVNRSARPVRIYIHPGLFRFDVTGPSGVERCAMPQVGRTPLRQSYRVLQPRGQSVETLEVTDFCPRGTFSDAGVYEVAAGFDSAEQTGPAGLQAFEGTVRGGVVLVRVTQGDEEAYEVRAPEASP